MSIYKPKNSPYWHYDFVIQGVRFHGSTGTTSKSAARTVEARERAAAAQRRGRKRQPITLNEAAGRYWTETAAHQASAATTEYQLANLCGGLGRGTALADINDDAIADYVARRRADVADASVNRETQLLRRLFVRADRTWRRDIGEMPDWRALMLAEPAGRVRELTPAEEAALFAALRPDFHPFVRFCLLTGVRLANALTLTWAQVDYGAAMITLRTKSRRPGGDVHTVPITQAVRVLLANERGRHPIFVFTYECARSRGKRRKGERYPFSQGGWRRDWTRALQAAGIADFRFHDTRHTAATRLLRACGNLAVVRDLLGHADITTTSRYAHVTKDDVRAAMEAAASRNSPEAAGDDAHKQLKERA